MSKVNFKQCLVASVCALVAAGSVNADTGQTEEDCVYARDVRTVEVLQEDMLLMHGSANRLWLNRLTTQCNGMDDRMILEFARYGSKLCSNDRVVARERGDLVGFTTSCRLGKFEPVAVEQVQALRQSLKES